MLNCGPKISSDSIFPNSYKTKLVYHDWDWAVKKRSDDIFGSVLRYKRHEIGFLQHRLSRLVAVSPVHELADEIIGYPALAFQHGQDTGSEDLLKLLYLALGKHIKCPIFTEKAISGYGMKMRMEPGVISKGVNDYHKAWNSLREAKHRTKENLKAFPCTMAEVCQKSPVILEIDTEKNGYAEYKLPVRYRIEDIVAYILSELDHLFGMTAWTEPPAFAAKCQEIFMAAVWICAPEPGKAFLQVSTLQVVMY